MKKSRLIGLLLVFVLLIGLYLFISSKENKKESELSNKGKDPIEELARNMSVEEKIGQMLMPAISGTEMNSQLEKIVKDYHLGGVILFSENIQTVEQTVKLINDIQKLSPKIPLFISVDQEGGLVYRLSEGTKLPGNMAIGATFSEKLAYENGKVIGSELKAVGINWDLAPVVDVNINPRNPVIGIRSFGGDPDLVAKLAVAYMKGLQEEGVASCIKHFPGHGDVTVDSHLGLGTVDKDRYTLDEVELKPFKKAIKAGADAIMTAHLSFPALDNTKVVMKAPDGTQREITIPATLSHKILTELVRKELGFEGVIITDAMNMKAISDNFGPVDAAVRAVKAGADIVLMPVDLDGAFNELVKQVKNGEIPESRIDESVKRILALKYKRGIMNVSTSNVEEMIKNAKLIVGCQNHLEIEKETAEKAITLIRNDGSILPLKDSDSSKKILVIGGNKNIVDNFVTQIEKYHPRNNNSLVISDKILNSDSNLTEEVKNAINDADIIILATNNITQRDNQIIKMVNYGKNKIFIGIAVRNPYDIMYYSNIGIYLAQYGWNLCNIKASVDVIFGQVNPSGKLPVEIPGFYPLGYGLTCNK
ncbi:MAG TPA: beta-N-acetylhexosaminidase [Clostridia bacterium]|nr:beta-N-acetylhexosaminidase [Clostridia bacterium]